MLRIATCTPKAEITARVPATNLEAFMQDVAGIGYFTANSRLDVEDKSLLYLENALKEKVRTEVVSKPLGNTATTVAKAQIIEAGDDIIEQQIANMAIDADVQYSVIDVSLYQNMIVQKEVTANYALSGYTLSLGQRFYNAFANGWVYFLMVAVAVAELWMFIISAAVVYFIYKKWHRKSKMLYLK